MARRDKTLVQCRCILSLQHLERCQCQYCDIMNNIMLQLLPDFQQSTEEDWFYSSLSATTKCGASTCQTKRDDHPDELKRCNMSSDPEKKHLHVVTPLVRSTALGKHLPACKEIYLKMETSQISGSFKIRGFGQLCQNLKDKGCLHLMAASSGNTGLAVACASQMIGIPCTVYVPENSPAVSAERIRQAGAEVIVAGTDFSEAVSLAEEAAKQPGASYVCSLEPDVWMGHATIVDELVTQLPDKPSVIVAAVGDGGLLTGVMKGLERAGWKDVPVVAIETVGTDCFNLSVKANKIVVLDKITSVATCLGNSCINPYLLNILPQFNVISEVVTDAEAVESCIRFVDDEYTLVEPGCGASLATVYCGVLARLHAEGKLPHLETRPAVIIVCGGRSVSLHLLQEWAKEFNVPFPASQD